MMRLALMVLGFVFVSSSFAVAADGPHYSMVKRYASSKNCRDLFGRRHGDIATHSTIEFNFTTERSITLKIDYISSHHHARKDSSSQGRVYGAFLSIAPNDEVTIIASYSYQQSPNYTVHSTDFYRVSKTNEFRNLIHDIVYASSQGDANAITPGAMSCAADIAINMLN